MVGGLARGVQQPLQALEPNYPFTDLILEHMQCPYVVPATVPIEPMHTADTGCLDMRSDVQFAHDLCFLLMARVQRKLHTTSCNAFWSRDMLILSR